jgi:hypothetical protein
MEHPLVPIHHQLMCTAYQADLVVAAEVAAHVATKQVACTTRAQAPSLYVLWVTPQQVTHCAIVRHLLLAIYCADLWGTKKHTNWHAIK